MSSHTAPLALTNLFANVQNHTAQLRQGYAGVKTSKSAQIQLELYSLGKTEIHLHAIISYFVTCWQVLNTFLLTSTVCWWHDLFSWLSHGMKCKGNACKKRRKKNMPNLPAVKESQELVALSQKESRHQVDSEARRLATKLLQSSVAAWDVSYPAFSKVVVPQRHGL